MGNTHETHHAAPGLRARISAGVNWFIPSHVRGGDLGVLRCARLVVAFAWALIALAIIYAAIFLSMNSMISAAALSTAIGVALVSLHIMRRTGSSFAAGNLLTAAFFGVLTFLACRLGGAVAFTLPWYAAVPVVALSTTGRRSALAWLAITALSVAAFYVVDCRGYSFPNDLPPHHYELFRLLGGIGLTVLMLALALLYEAARNQTLVELNRVKDSLLQERDFSDAAIASLPGIFYLFDSVGKFLRWNENFEQVSGYSSEELSKMQPLDFFRGQDREAIEQSVADILAKGQATAEACFITEDGTAIPHSFSGKRVSIDGKLHLVGMGIDITDRREAEATLREAKEQADASARRAEQTLADMERMNAVMMGREQRVLEMKHEVNDLLAQLGEARKYEHVKLPLDSQVGQQS